MAICCTLDTLRTLWVYFHNGYLSFPTARNTRKRYFFFPFFLPSSLSSPFPSFFFFFLVSSPAGIPDGKSTKDCSSQKFLTLLISMLSLLQFTPIVSCRPQELMVQDSQSSCDPLHLCVSGPTWWFALCWQLHIGSPAG